MLVKNILLESTEVSNSASIEQSLRLCCMMDFPVILRLLVEELHFEKHCLKCDPSASLRASLVAQVVKESACNAGDPGSIPGLGRSPRGVNGNPLQHSCLENPKNRGAWRAEVHGVAKSWARLSD